MDRFDKGSDSFLESVLVAVSGFLRGSTGLLLEVDEFIVICVAFDKPDLVDPGPIEFLWSFLEVLQVVLDVFVCVNPTWDGEN